MLVYQTSGIMIAFGDASTSFAPQQFYSIGSSQKMLACAHFVQASAHLQLTDLAVLKQVHGTTGYTINDSLVPYALEGDYLITTRKRTGLAVATADCVPIILYDSEQQLLSVIHAGWRGSLAGIIEKTVTDMRSHAQQLHVILGPCARACCYEVDELWTVQHKDILTGYPDTVIMRDGKIFFDQVGFIIAQLTALGVQSDAINTQYALCTICNIRFCSYRRDKELAQRQMTIACLL